MLKPATAKLSSRIIVSLAAGLTLAVLPLNAQRMTAPQGIQPSTSILLAGATLPDSPSVTFAEERGSSSAASSSVADYGFQAQVARPTAGPTDKYIAPGQSAPPLTVGNKIVLGIKDAVSPFAAIGWAISAGYSQGLDNSPNYGTDGKAFAQRFGASAARATSEGIFSDSIMASVLHEDPRYYRMGPGQNVLKRIAYAATRTIITRTDGGHTTPNFALVSGNLAGSYLTKAYYPPLNQSNVEVLRTFGGSIGGSALGFGVSEFFPDFLHLFHKNRN